MGLTVVATLAAGCNQRDATTQTSPTLQTSPASGPATNALASSDSHSAPKGSTYEPPTAEEMAPMRREYLTELAKISEPPEMTGKPMQVRKAAPPNALKMLNVMSAVGAPEKATHQQRETTINELLQIANSIGQGDGVNRTMTFGVIAAMACIDGADPQTVIGYANKAISGDDGDALALRARMYLQAGDKKRALGDLEKIMAAGDGHSLVGGGVDPRKESAPCGWSIADFDALGDDPRALAAKALYLSSFIGFGAEDRGTVKESTIRELYSRSARAWRSPIPHFLNATTVEGLGSEQSMNRAGCIRESAAPNLVKACAKYDAGIRQQNRELTMALVINPTFVPALSKRANSYLHLAQAAYADGKPSRQLFELAIDDYTAAIAAGGKNQNVLYLDRALALASIGRYQEAAVGYEQGMKYAKSGIENDPFTYKQLAGLYMKLGKFNEAANLITQAIINASGGGMDTVIFGGGIRAFRTLYPEYELLPDEILAEAVRRRYQPQFPQSWDTDFISKGGNSNGKVVSSILPDLYAMRGDAYEKAARYAEALADYRRLKSDAWWGDEKYLPKNRYFDERGYRIFDLPEPWPPTPPTE